MALENSHKVFICTGRNKVSIKSELSKATLDCFIASSGSCIEIDNRVIHNRYYDDKLVNQVRLAFEQNNIRHNLEFMDIIYLNMQWLIILLLVNLLNLKIPKLQD